MELMRRVLIVWGYIQLFLLSLTFRIYPQASADVLRFGDAQLFSNLGGALFFGYFLLIIYRLSRLSIFQKVPENIEGIRA